jgi:uncharacterized protein YecE (DUF72 family)
MRAAVRRDRDQRDLLRPAEPEELGGLGGRGARRLPVRDQGLALLRHPAEAGRRRRGWAISFAQGLAALGPKLGPILWMLARAASSTATTSPASFDLLPRELDGIRCATSSSRATKASATSASSTCAARHDVAVVFGDDDEFPCIDADTASFAYARLQRMREEVPTGYDDARSTRSRSARARWQADGRDSYIFMINGAKVRAPAAALALQERLR